MTGRPDLEQLTSVAEKWLRRCNGQPAAGIAINRATLRVVLAANVDVHLDPEGRIVWRAPGNGRAVFTAEPVAGPAPRDVDADVPPIARVGIAS